MAGIEKSEDIDNKIYEIFDELQKSLESKQKFHPSEEFGKTYGNHLPSFEPHIVINKYHSYCPRCSDHFYSQSFINDINSFFQKHINTKYHKANRLLSSISDSEPIFKWEKWLCTGYCNVCEMSGIHAFIIETSHISKKLAEVHECKYEKQIVDNYFRYLKKVERFKLYCALNVFNEKFLQNYGNCTVCFLCMEAFFGSKEKNYYHLATDGHFASFYSFVMKTFNLNIKDLFNGFHLEKVTAWILNNDFKKDYSISKIYNDREKCLEESNSSLHPYSRILKYSGFSPKFVENLLTECVEKNGMCSICNTNNKATDKSYLLGNKVCMHTHSKIFKSYKDLLEAYSKLELELSVYGLKIGMEFQPDFDNAILKSISHNSCVNKSKIKTLPWEVSDTNDIVQEKLKFLKETFSNINNKLYCEYCETVVPQNFKLTHVEQKNHKRSVSSWNKLIVQLNNPNFIEPLRKVKYYFICFTCKTHLNDQSLFQHLKGFKHSKTVQSITDQSLRTIWTNFEFMSNYTCYCKKCNTEISGKGSSTALKAMITNIFDHWPCFGEPVKLKKNASENKESALETLINESGSELKHSKAESFDFLNYQKTHRSLITVFEDKIIEHVNRNINLSIKNSLENSTTTNDTTSNKENSPESMEEKMSFSGSDSSLDLRIPLTVGETSKEASPVAIQPNGVNHKSDTLNHEVVENVSAKIKNLSLEVKSINSNPENADRLENILNKDEEELILYDVPEKKNLRKQILNWLENFGELKYILFKKNTGFVGFVLKGIAEEVAKKQTIPIGKEGIKMEFQLRKDKKKKKYKYPPLNKFIGNILSDSLQLTDFMSELILQSVIINTTPSEKRREKILCNAIIKALMHNYPYSKCYPFGSRLSGLTLSNSDLDVFLDSGGMYEGLKSPKSERDFVNQIAHMLRGSGEFKQLIVVDRARVPIISFQHKVTNLHCDLSFKNALGVQNTFLLRYMVSLDPRVKCMILFLKRWADLNCLHGPPYFSSYALAMLVIFYLQHPPDPILPNIECLKLNFVGRRMTIGGWDCNFSTDATLLPQTSNGRSLPELWLGFFKFYAEFDYSKYVISPLTGEPLPREAFSDSPNFKLPMCIKRHILNIPPPIKNLVQPDFSICIMDPFDLSHILTKNFPRRAHDIFVHFCKKSAELLEKCLETDEKVVPSSPESKIT